MNPIEKKTHRWTSQARRFPSRLVWSLLLAPTLMLPLGGCDKLLQKATEKVTEKLIEFQMEEDGGQAKVDLSDGKTQVTITDAQGKVMQMQMEGAQVQASDFSLPFYPGARALDKESQRIQTSEQRMVSAVFESQDSREKIAAFYRQGVRGLAGGRIVLDNADDQRTMLALADHSDRSLIVQIEAAGKNTQRITLTSTTPIGK